MELPVTFHFRERKAAQAAARLLRRHGRPMPSERLAALLYLADRRALLETGLPVTGDRWIPTHRGPAPKRVLQLLDAPAGASAIWSGYVASCPDRTAIPADDHDDGQLSDYDRQLLDDTHDQFGPIGETALTAHLQALPEWCNPSSEPEPIDPRAILRTAGRHPDHINDIAKQSDAARDLAALAPE